MTKEYKIVKSLHVKKHGIFDMDKLYKFVYAWLDDRKYFYHEKLYKHKPGYIKGNEVELEIGAIRKVTDYVRYDVSIEFHLWDVVDVDVIKHGKKMKMSQARMDIKIDAGITTDYEGRWEKNGFYKKLNEFYERYIIKKTIEDVWAYEIYSEAYDLHTKIVQILEQEVARNG
jgi:hypothetical protein